MPLRTTALLAAAGAVTALAVLPSPAPAAPKIPGAPQMETFKVTIRGSQVSTWSLREADDPDDPCDTPTQGDGSQMVRFFSKPTKVQVLRDGAGAIVAQEIKAPLTVEREGESRSQPTTPDCPTVAIGDDDGLVPLVRDDCGTKRGTISMRLEFGDAKPEDDFLVPLVAKNTVQVAGEFADEIRFDDCPWWLGSGDQPSDRGVDTVARKFAIKNLWNPRRKTLKASADLTRNYSSAGFTGRTILTWNLRMVRVRG